MADATIEGRIVKVSGPLVVASGMAGCRMYDVVRVGEKGVIGEIIELGGIPSRFRFTKRVVGVGPGEKVTSTGLLLASNWGLASGSIFDGIQRLS